jgi:hypothetical protein
MFGHPDPSVTSDAFLPAVHTRPDYLNVVRPVAPNVAPSRCSSGPVPFRSGLQAMGTLAALVSPLLSFSWPSWPLRTLADDFIAWLLAIVRNRVPSVRP